MLLASGNNFGLSWILELVTVPILLWFVVRKFPGPIVKNMMDAKLEQIRASLAAGEEAKAESAALVEQRRRELEEAKAEAVTIVDTARRAAEQLVADGLRRAEEEYQRIVDSASAAVELERSRVRDQISTELGGVVVAAALEVIEAELDAGNQRRLIGEAIDAAETAGI